ncbi:MAG: PF20097 family protein [Candidatus Kariarchaeaceae archaeon]
MRERSNECPYCDCEMKMGFLVPVFALDWAEYVSTSGQVQDNVIRLSGVLEPVNRLPALHCSECGVLISQVE